MKNTYWVTIFTSTALENKENNNIKDPKLFLTP